MRERTANACGKENEQIADRFVRNLGRFVIGDLGFDLVAMQADKGPCDIISHMDQNPYISPRASQDSQMDRDERLLRLILSRFLQWRIHPPTIASFLFSFRSWPLLAMAGITSVVVLVGLGAPSELCWSIAGFYLGAALGDFGYARRAARAWGFQEGLMDWNKIEAYAREMSI
jgi:hypothetical protein